MNHTTRHVRGAPRPSWAGLELTTDGSSVLIEHRGARKTTIARTTQAGAHRHQGHDVLVAKGRKR